MSEMNAQFGGAIAFEFAGCCRDCETTHAHRHCNAVLAQQLHPSKALAEHDSHPHRRT
jgi:hypothetical protein